MAWLALAALVAGLLLAGLLALRLRAARRVAAERGAELARLQAHGETVARQLSHELRGPLGVLHGAAALAADALRRGAPEQAAPLVDAIAEQAGATLATSEALVAFARAGHAPLERAAVPLGAVVAAAADTLRAEGRIDGLELVLPEALPALDGDAALLREVFRELLLNAAAFAADGAPAQVRLQARRIGDRAEVTLADRGIGFPPAFAERLFEPLVRAHADRGGAGMGLARVRVLVERHGGTVRAEAPPEGGARFVLVLPAAG